MKLQPERMEMLAGFEKRMKFLDIARYLLDYPYERKDKIKAMIPQKDVMDNLVMAVLVFIKERTLGREQNCTLEDIADFLEELAPLLPENCRMEPAVLARFIVVEVLQRSGALTNYEVLFPEKESFGQVPIRMIEEEKGTYHLTDDAFDFLFRSKEIESELDYSVTRFRMAEYMRRDNYTEALDQSRELVSRIRSIKVTMDDFLRQCRENIGRVAEDQYDKIFDRIRELLNSENEELKADPETGQRKGRQAGTGPPERHGRRKHRQKAESAE